MQPTEPTPPPVRRGPPRFSLRGLLLITAIVAIALSHWRTSHELRCVRTDLTTARNELHYIDAPDDDHLYAVELPAYDSMVWRWRLQLPATGRYRIAWALSSEIPESGMPTSGVHYAEPFRDNSGQPLPGGEPFIFNLALAKASQDRWALTYGPGRQITTRYLTDPPGWLEGKTDVGWGGRVAGSDGTVTVEPDQPLVLLRHRKSKQVPGGSTVEMNPTDGLMVWVEAVP